MTICPLLKSKALRQIVGQTARDKNGCIHFPQSTDLRYIAGAASIKKLHIVTKVYSMAVKPQINTGDS